MAFQLQNENENDGWPLGLHRLNVHNQSNASVSGSLVADSGSFSSDSSSDLDTESTGSSFFYDKSITLGNLIGIQSDVGVNARAPAGEPRRHKRNCRSKSWWGLCGSSNGAKEEGSNSDMPPSLGHFLEVERRAAASTRREKMFFNMMFDDFTCGTTMLDPNPLFADGQILPPNSHSHTLADGNAPHPSCALADLFREAPSRNNSVTTHHQRNHSSGSRVPTFFSGICGRTSIEA